MLLKTLALVFLIAFTAGSCGNKSQHSNTKSELTDNNAQKKPEGLLIEKKEVAKLPSHIINQLSEFKELIISRDSVQISKLIQLPLKRPNKLISTRQEFIEYFPDIFDQVLSDKIVNLNISHEDIIVRSDDYGILGGKIWFRNSGQIFAITYKSEIEEKRLTQNKEAIKELYHESVPNYNDPILRFETPKFYVSILSTEDDDLYVSWRKPKTISDKPDLILRKGAREFMGSMGGYEYTFSNGDISYIITKYNLGPDDDLGIKLTVKQQAKIILEEKAIRQFE